MPTTNRYYTSNTPSNSGSPGFALAQRVNMIGPPDGTFGVSGSFAANQQILHPLNFIPDGDGLWPTGGRTIVAVRVGATIKTGVTQVDVDMQGICNTFNGDFTQTVGTTVADLADTFTGSPGVLATLTDASIQNGTNNCGIFLVNQSGSINTFSIDSVWMEIDWVPAASNAKPTKVVYDYGYACGLGITPTFTTSNAGARITGVGVIVKG